MGVGDLVDAVEESRFSKMFFFDDVNSPNYFWKQFISGAFIAIVMTGLDQDMMQKNLTVRTLGDAQKNMFWFTLVLVFVNLLFLALGAMLYLYIEAKGIALPERTDSLYPMLALNYFPKLAGVLFLLGIIAAAYSSADSALTALTTSFCVDILGFEKRTDGVAKTNTRRMVHIGFSLITLIVIVAFNALNDKSVINQVFRAAGYTYGPLLGLFMFGILTKRAIRDSWTPLVCILAPVLSFIIDMNSEAWLGGFKFGFFVLLLNGALMLLGLWLISLGAGSRSLERVERVVVSVQ